MASFEKALKPTLAAEGIYSNDPVDPGGETYCGISRKHNPDWSGWKDIDAGHHPSADRVAEFYKPRYWDVFRGDELSSDMVAQLMFDFAVNAGVHRAVQQAQRAASVVALYSGEERLIQDGGYGPKTHRVIASIGAHEVMWAVYYLGSNIEYYQSIILQNERLSKFAKGWANRCIHKLDKILSAWKRSL